MPQTSIQYSPAKGYEGMQATHAIVQRRGAAGEYVVGGAVRIPFGRAVVFNTDGKIILPSATTQRFAGLAGANIQWGETENGLLTGTPAGFNVGEPIGPVVQGDFWVYSETAVAIGDPAFYRAVAAAAPNNVVGRWRNAAAAGETVAVTNAKFATATAGPGLVILSLFGNV